MRRLRIRYPYVYHTPVTDRTPTAPLSGRLSVIPGTDLRCLDEKLLYTKVAQNISTNMNALPAYPPHPFNIPNIEPPPSGPSVRWFVRYCKSTRMNLFRTRKLFGIVQLPRIHNPHMCRMSTTPPAWFPPPPNTLSGNHPEVAVHLWMNFRFEQRASYPR